MSVEGQGGVQDAAWQRPVTGSAEVATPATSTSPSSAGRQGSGSVVPPNVAAGGHAVIEMRGVSRIYDMGHLQVDRKSTRLNSSH